MLTGQGRTFCKSPLHHSSSLPTFFCLRTEKIIDRLSHNYYRLCLLSGRVVMSKKKYRGIMQDEMLWEAKPLTTRQLLDEVNEATHYGSTTGAIKSLLETSPEFVKLPPSESGSYSTSKWWLKDLKNDYKTKKRIKWTFVMWKYFFKLRLVDGLTLSKIAIKMNMRLGQVKGAQKIYRSGRPDALSCANEVLRKHKKRCGDDNDDE